MNDTKNTQNTQNTQNNNRKIKSYAIRAGRMTKTQKLSLETLFCEHGFDIKNPDLIINYINQKPTVLEIGFGMGDGFISHIKNTSEINSNIQFLGIEVHPPGVGNTLNLIKENDINNCKIIQNDAIYILDNIIKDNSLSGLQLFFPDPWPKKRHHKRRIVNHEFLNLIKNKLKNNAYFHIATDWEPYSNHVIDILSSFPNFKPSTQDQLPVATRTETKFERRGTKLGHDIFDLIYILNK